MRYALLLFALLLSSCSTGIERAADYDPVYSYNPCDDSILVALRAVPPESLSDRQYQMLLEKERGCTNYAVTMQAARMQADSTRVLANEVGALRGAIVGLFILSVIGGVVAAIQSQK